MKIFDGQEVGFDNPVILRTPGRYAMAPAVAIIKWLEAEHDGQALSSGWDSAGHGDLVEVGVPIRVGGIEVLITCSHDDLLLALKTGNKATFLNLCSQIRDLDFSDEQGSDGLMATRQG